MSHSHTHGLTDRLGDGAKARSAALARFRARPSADDPTVLARQSARRAVVEARAVRVAERAVSRRAEAERAAARKVELKAQRDARYLARKAKALARR